MSGHIHNAIRQKAPEQSRIVIGVQVIERLELGRSNHKPLQIVRYSIIFITYLIIALEYFNRNH
jgi:hypothetical protein